MARQVDAKKKWLEVPGDRSWVEAAQAALKSRLKHVERYLPLAAHRSDEDPEHVHQLRVATRRGHAALRLFDDVPGKRRRKRFQKRLREFRRAARDPRELDVILSRLKDAAKHAKEVAEDANGVPGAAEDLEVLIEHVQEARDTAQRPLEKLYRDLPQRRFHKQIKKLAKKLSRVDAKSDKAQLDPKARPAPKTKPDKKAQSESKPEIDAKADAASSAEQDGAATSANAPEANDFRSKARGRLRAAVDEFFFAAGGDLDQTAELHAFRIAGKRLRYAIELLASAFDSSVLREDIYPQISKLQELLGELNDHVGAKARFEAWHADADLEEIQPLISSWVEREEKSLEESLRKFQDWWQPERCQSLRAQLAELLGVSADDLAKHEPTNAASDAEQDAQHA